MLHEKAKARCTRIPNTWCGLAKPAGIGTVPKRQKTSCYSKIRPFFSPRPRHHAHGRIATLGLLHLKERIHLLFQSQHGRQQASASLALPSHSSSSFSNSRVLHCFAGSDDDDDNDGDTTIALFLVLCIRVSSNSQCAERNRD